LEPPVAPGVGPEVDDLERVDDPASARRALRSIGQLQRSAVAGALEQLDVTDETAREIEEAFGILSEGQARLVEHWFAHEALREADLLAQVFHDLRSPLTSVLFLSDALYSGQSGSLSDAQRRQVQLIYAASLTLLTLVDNVLSSRNLEAGEVEPERVPFSLSALSGEVERITSPLAAQRKLELSFHMRAGTARIGDPDALRRVLLNLVTNAINYTDEGGVTVRFLDAGDDLQAIVEDTGPGIDDEELAELFTPFRGRRARAAERPGRRRRFSGAGLGLSICHRLTRLMDGDIWVDTEMGKGSRFVVQVPFPSVGHGIR
ncbi:MAG TPA: HAMP domain-containing sensor histidine kinase, partial [Actinomycetota bacterium]|nr:HAMP domain-containing sensor histidine kinase [Actinomycetota bacterium]